MPNLVAEINAITERRIWPKKVFDLAFKRKSALLAYMRAHSLSHPGGSHIQQTLLVNKAIGGSYLKGATFDLATQEYVDANQFVMKYYYANDTQLLETVEVENAPGATQIFSKIKIAQEVMILTLNEILAIALYRHGQAAGTGVVDDRSADINGLAEIANNGLDNSWDGNRFPTYGGNSRRGSTETQLNSTPVFYGNADGSAGPITYAGLLEAWIDAKNGEWAPDLNVMNKYMFAYVLERLQPQQRINDPSGKMIWGGSDFSLMGMRTVIDEYCPSSRNGVNDARTGNFLTSAFTSHSAPTTASNLPTSTSVTPGEVGFMLNPRLLQLHISKAKRFQFGWSGYKEAQDSNIIAGQMLFAGNVTCQAPYGIKQYYGVNS